jgi:ribonuclease D
VQTQIVDTPERLLQLCQALEGQDRVGLDTEFHSERRYQPDLMLVQLATSEQSWLVDPLSIDLAPLGPVLRDLQWVCHGSSHDIALMERATGALPKSLLDTQILAAMCHMRFPIGLANLSDKLLSRGISKCPALSDWSKRPLSDTQRRYAATDAEVVLELTDKLIPRMPHAQTMSWVEQAGQDLIQTALEPPDPDRAWKTLNLASRLDAPTRRVLHHVHSWRDQLARQKGQPPYFILGDSLALSLSRNRPRDLDELCANRRIPQGIIRRHGADLLDVIARGLADRSPPPWVPSPPECQSARLLIAWAEAIEDDLGIASSLLMPWKLALEIAHRRHKAWNGWRAEAAGEAFDDFLSGRVRLQMGRKGPRLV